MNPLAVELAKLSIWLITLAKGRPFGFLDHNLRCGDSLLGITNLEQLHYLDMNPGEGSTKKLFASKIDQAVTQAIELRSELRSRPIRDIRDVEVMAQLDEKARRKLEMPELVADVLIGEVFEAGGEEIDTTALSIIVGGALTGDEKKFEDLTRRAQTRLSSGALAAKKSRRPFHWPLEFPEVFGRDTPGFDAFVGNPPFVGGKRISGAFGPLYQKYLVNHLTLARTGSVDLVVHFFIRVHSLLRRGGYAGLLGRRSINEATNREVGLRQLLDRGVTIYTANTNLQWPGEASVVVHQIQMTSDKWHGRRVLNGIAVDVITEELSDKEVWEIQKLDDNLGRMFQGTILSGEGFKISPESADSLLTTAERYKEVVFPFIGGNEINKDASCRPMCWVICFWDWPEERAKTFKEAYSIVEAAVKPERLEDIEAGGESNWWLYLRPRPELYHAIGRGSSFVKHPDGWHAGSVRTKLRVLTISTGTTKYPAFTFLPSGLIYSNKLCVLADDRFEMFAVLSSDIHGIWAWARKTTLQADMESMRYAHGNIFETFPFPSDMFEDGERELELLGSRFFEGRRAFMKQHDFGLTNFYNEFHDPDNNVVALKDLRKLQAEMNVAVLERFDWPDVDPATGFHEVGYLPDGKNVRFTVSEQARLEVLRRLSKLNNARFDAQSQSVSAAKSATADKASLADAEFEDGLFRGRGGKA